MTECTDVNGPASTDDGIEGWAAAAESEQGYTGGHIAPSVPGRPISVGRKARPFTLRLDTARRAKLDEAAQERHITLPRLMRDLIDAL